MSNPWEYSPPGHPGIGIRLHRCSGQPCLLGTRLPAEMIAAYFVERREPGDGDPYDAVRRMWDVPLVDEMIDAAVRWVSDPEHKRIHRNTLRRQRYAESRGTGANL